MAAVTLNLCMLQKLNVAAITPLLLEPYDFSICSIIARNCMYCLKCAKLCDVGVGEDLCLALKACKVLKLRRGTGGTGDEWL